MASEMLLVRHLNGFRAADPVSLDMLSKIPRNQPVRATIARPRNPQHHRKFWALISVVFEAQDVYPTSEHLLDAIKIATGHCDKYQLGDQTVVKPRSISFASLDQASFEEFYNRAVEVILTKILPGINRDDLEREVLEIMEGYN